MKKFVSAVLSLLLLAALAGTALAEGGLPLDETAFPDAALRDYVSAFDSDGDGELSEAELAAVTVIDLSNGGAGLGVVSLTGLESFTALRELNCSGNAVAALELGAFPALERLNVSGTALTALNLSASPALRELKAAAPGLVSLDLTPCAALAAAYTDAEPVEEEYSCTDASGAAVTLPTERYEKDGAVLLLPSGAAVTPARPVPPCEEHSWDEGVETTAAGCETPGVIRYTCLVCGETRTEETEPLGHDYVWTVTVSADCETPGEETEICSHDAGHTRDTRVIEPLGHDYVWTVTVPADCTNVGEEREICSRDERHVGQTRELPALGHRWDDGVETVAPACEKAGVRTFTCLVCGETRTEAIPALTHVWDEGTVTLAATCTEPGSVLYTCRNDASHTKTEAIPAAGHRYEGGLCAVCGTAQPGFIPRLTEGNGGVAHYGSDYTLRCNAAFSTFQGVTVDGNIVARDNYKLSSGSTVITLNAAYVRQLSAGTHTVAVSTALGTASGAFSVSTSPKTGDTNNLWLWAALLGVSAAAIVAAVILLTRRRKRR